MKRLLLALDLDGTLLNSSLSISPETKKRLREFRRHGHLVTIATGRPLQATRKYALELDIDIPLILNNGALIADAEGKVHHFNPVEPSLARIFLDYCRDQKLPCSIYVGEDIYQRRPDPLGAKLHQTHDLTVPRVATDLDQIISLGIANFAVPIEVERLEAVYRQMQAEFARRLQVVRTEKYFLDIFNLGVSKGEALQNLAALLDVEQKNVVAVGDNHNDLEMLRYAGLGVAMDGADALVKQNADYITAGNDEDGIALLIKKILASADHLTLASSNKGA